MKGSFPPSQNGDGGCPAPAGASPVVGACCEAVKPTKAAPCHVWSDCAVATALQTHKALVDAAICLASRQISLRRHCSRTWVMRAAGVRAVRQALGEPSKVVRRHGSYRAGVLSPAHARLFDAGGAGAVRPAPPHSGRRCLAVLSQMRIKLCPFWPKERTIASTEDIQN